MTDLANISFVVTCDYWKEYSLPVRNKLCQEHRGQLAENPPTVGLRCPDMDGKYLSIGPCALDGSMGLVATQKNIQDSLRHNQYADIIVNICY